MSCVLCPVSCVHAWQDPLEVSVTLYNTYMACNILAIPCHADITVIGILANIARLGLLASGFVPKYVNPKTTEKINSYASLKYILWKHQTNGCWYDWDWTWQTLLWPHNRGWGSNKPFSIGKTLRKLWKFMWLFSTRLPRSSQEVIVSKTLVHHAGWFFGSSWALS